MPALESLRQEDCEFKVSLDSILRSCPQRKERNGHATGQCQAKVPLNKRGVSERAAMLELCKGHEDIWAYI